jgi:hypothetical protein
VRIALRGEEARQTVEQAESSLVARGEYRSAPRCCGDVKVSQCCYSFWDCRNNITPLGSLTNLLPLLCHDSYSSDDRVTTAA